MSRAIALGGLPRDYAPPVFGTCPFKPRLDLGKMTCEAYDAAQDVWRRTYVLDAPRSTVDVSVTRVFANGDEGVVTQWRELRTAAIDWEFGVDFADEDLPF